MGYALQFIIILILILILIIVIVIVILIVSNNGVILGTIINSINHLEDKGQETSAPLYPLPPPPLGVVFLPQVTYIWGVVVSGSYSLSIAIVSSGVPVY